MRRSALLVAILATGCMARTHIPWMRPAPVTLPAGITMLAPVDRVNAHLSQEAVAELVQELLHSPRFGIVEPERARAALATHGSPLGMPLTPDATGAICGATGASGLVVLEQLEPRPRWEERSRDVTRIRTEEVTENGETRVREIREDVVVYDAILVLEYDAYWSTYACDGTIVDSQGFVAELRQHGEGASPSEARSNVGEQGVLHREAAAEVALRYAHRIAPMEDSLERRYYRGGSPEIRAGAKAARNGAWDRARKQWDLAVESTYGKARGKALFDRALAAEQADELEQALDLARQAAEILENDASEAYVTQLRRRVRLQKKLDRQLAPPLPEVPAVPEAELPVKEGHRAAEAEATAGDAGTP